MNMIRYSVLLSRGPGEGGAGGDLVKSYGTIIYSHSLCRRAPTKPAEITGCLLLGPRVTQTGRICPEFGSYPHCSITSPILLGENCLVKEEVN